MSGNIMRAMMAATDEERDRYVNRETLLFAVQRKITCDATGVVLDVRTAVYVRVGMPDGTSGASVFTGTAYDVMAEGLAAKVASIPGATLEIIDGRTLGD